MHEDYEYTDALDKQKSKGLEPLALYFPICTHPNSNRTK